jgi:mono/diheme cytochrome c family protein
MLRKILKWTCLVILFAIAGITIVTALRQHLTFEAPYPAIKASTDPAVIAKGRHIVTGPGHCFDCHSTAAKKDSLLNAGIEPALSGGFAFKLPFGTFYTRNLTPDPETGIGKLTDSEIAREIRHSVKPNGEAMLPFMPFQNMTDEELTAVISYLRSLKPVRNPVPDHDYNLMGRVIKAYMIKPDGPSEIPKKAIAADTSAIYGRHLVMAVANCNECHTKRDGIGKYVGEPLAGGTTFEEEGKPTLVSPNLTPDPSSGRIYNWSQEQFIKRFRMGKLIPYSHMPWDAYGRMSDDELKAIYNYLKSLKPVNTNKPAKKA